MKVTNVHTQDKVLQTAKQIMLEFGLKGVNMNKLAKQSGVAKATLYKIINSKEDLISKIALDFFSETFGHLFESILKKESFESFTKKDIEHFVSLAVGKMRVIQKQVFLEYPIIENQFRDYLKDYKVRIVDKFTKLQNNGLITKNITPENIYIFIRITFMHMVLSSYSDIEVKNLLMEMYYVFFCGLKTITIKDEDR